MNDSMRGRAAELPLLCRERGGESVLPDRAAMAKASLTEREKRARFGQILRRASQIAGLSRKETAARLRVDEGQLGRWFSGDENCQVHRYHGDDELRDALRIAEAEDAGHVTVRTVIEMVRRTA